VRYLLPVQKIKCEGGINKCDNHKRKINLNIAIEQMKTKILSNYFITVFFYFTESSKDSKKKKQDENPFSFKKFLASSGSGVKPRDRNDRGYHQQQQRTSQNTPDFATDLPDFVQDHFQDSPTDSQLPPKLDFPLPDLGFPNESTQRGSSNSFSEQFSVRNDDFRNLSSDSLRAKGVFTPNNSASDLVSGIGEVNTVNVNNIDAHDIMINRPHVPTSLPDFITDGILKNTDSTQADDIFLPQPQDYRQKGPKTAKNGANQEEECERVNHKCLEWTLYSSFWGYQFLSFFIF
jgi:hypothetical protein